jgi:hypothetical protein
MAKFSYLRLRTTIAISTTLLLVAACGGGVGSGGTGYISGAAIKGPVDHATMTAYAISAGQTGAQIGTSTTDGNGSFSMQIGSYAGPVLLQMSGGGYTDEATGRRMDMAAGDVLTAVVPSVAAGATVSGVQVTPLTAMAQAMAQHMTDGLTDANIAAANTAIGNHFSVSNILNVQPMNPLLDFVPGTSQDAQNYGMTLAAMSQSAKTLGLSSSSSMVTAMMKDASDGVLDGKEGSTPVQMGGMGGGMMLSTTAGTSGMGAAMNAFMNSTQNKSGIATTTLMTNLNAANGQLASAATAMKNATISGTAFNGPVSAGTMMAFALNNGSVGAQIASVAVDGQGNFTLPLGSYSGGIMLQMSGARYLDEATQTITTMAANNVMSAVLATVPSDADISGVWVTPVTAMAQARAQAMSGGMTDANIAAAITAMGNYFAVNDILHTQPINPTVTGAGTGASQDALNYGMALAAMSQYAKTLNLPSSSALVMAMMSDAADGVLDGKSGTSPISLPMSGMMGTSSLAVSAGSSLASAMSSFMGSVLNASGLTAANMTTLMQKLINSNGQI